MTGDTTSGTATDRYSSATLRTLMRDGTAVLGINVRAMRNADIAHIARASGHHFLFVDTQHAIYDRETIVHMAQAAAALGIPLLVRARSVLDPDVPALLDCGVAGIVFPDVNTAEQAEEAVRRTRFAPLGTRSVGGAYSHFSYRPTPTGEIMRRLNEDTLIVLMVESPQGMENLDAIAAVPGYDVIHLGSNDLLAAMGKPGRFDEPEIVEAQRRVIEAARMNGKQAGCGGNRDVARQARAIRSGARFLTTQTDIAFLMEAATRWTKGVADSLAEPI